MVASTTYLCYNMSMITKEFEVANKYNIGQNMYEAAMMSMAETNGISIEEVKLINRHKVSITFGSEEDALTFILKGMIL